ncbi:Rab geranylgeranyltransferase [Starmerella bacillaris]|uniref:Geranylgeranyl transferase type-2 subunit beta n=1 Tax=Starmerella bacillaris TaxID=1247836 RepID=A0AAV5RGH8_STABA|nr:Rab geranylgeranyltransferase [Starmerella bacillaris]
MELLADKHLQYVEQLDKSKDDLQYWLTSHLRMNGLYWALNTTFLLQKPDLIDKEKIIDFVLSCYDESSGGFSADTGLDPHLLYTLSALQILYLEDSLDRLPDRNKTINFVKELHQPDGGFSGDKYGETDARFVYNAIQSLLILNALDEVDMTNTCTWLQQCQNYDGGFGFMPGEESHGAMAFTVVGALKILGKLDLIDSDRAATWLSDRQTDSGGLNGRPEKLPDVCYSWWVLSGLAILNKVDWIDKQKLSNFILQAQDPDKGGIADRPDNEVDIFHTVFGLAGLSLLGHPGLAQVDPIVCLPSSISAKLYKDNKLTLK